MPTPAQVRIRQDRQVRSSEGYDDVLPSGPSLQQVSTLQDDLNALRSQVARLLNTNMQTRWYQQPASGIAQIVNNIQYIEGQMGLAGPAREYDQDLTGPKNGVNRSFTTYKVFQRGGVINEAVYWNGVLLVEGSGKDYVAEESIPGNGYDTIVLLIAPIAEDTLSIDFTPVSI